jgi:thioester reductase-like protein
MRSLDGGVFVTGTTGILGSYVLKLLLEETAFPLHCLVRASNEEEGYRRLASSLLAYDPGGSLLPRLRERVRVELGDVSQESLGLSPERREALCARIDAVVHVAALTDLFLTYRRIAPVNVKGTENVVRFTLGTKRKYLAHVSTHTIVGDRSYDPSTVFRETDYDVGQGFEHLSYQRSKFEAEGIVRRAKDEGLVWNVLRPGQIFGEAATGAYPLGHSAVTGLFYDIWKTVLESRVAYLSNVHFDVVPVDYVSRGILELGIRAEENFQTYHLTNPHVLRYTQVIQTLAETGYPIQLIPQEEYERRIHERRLRWDGTDYKSSTTSAFRWWFKRGIRLVDGGYTCSAHTARLLAERGVHCPRIDRKLLGTYVDAGVAAGYFPRAPRTVSERSHDMEASA